MLKTYPTLSIRQPWAGLLALGIKPVENRTWSASPHYYGKEFLIHAGKQVDRDVVKKGQTIEDAAFELVKQCDGNTADFYELIHGRESVFKTGGLVGRAVLNGCTQIHPSKWAMPDQIHWLFEKASPVPFRPLKGQLKIFAVEFGSQHV